MELVARKLSQSRTAAQALIERGAVRVDSKIAQKASQPVTAETTIEVLEKLKYVSRGGEKLEKALVTFGIDVGGRVCVDGGISTGGFSDCLLQHGASKIYGIEVGHGQLAEKLSADERIVLFENTNLRNVTPEQVYKGESELATLAVLDLSFIPLRLVLPNIWNLLRSPRDLIVLIKPQFEVGPSEVGKKGVVKNRAAQCSALSQIAREATTVGWNLRNVTWSPLLGGEGNIEFLAWFNDSPATIHFDEKTFSTLVDNAWKELS